MADLESSSILVLSKDAGILPANTAVDYVPTKGAKGRKKSVGESKDSEQQDPKTLTTSTTRKAIVWDNVTASSRYLLPSHDAQMFVLTILQGSLCAGVGFVSQR